MDAEMYTVKTEWNSGLNRWDDVEYIVYADGGKARHVLGPHDFSKNINQQEQENNQNTYITYEQKMLQEHNNNFTPLPLKPAPVANEGPSISNNQQKEAGIDLSRNPQNILCARSQQKQRDKNPFNQAQKWFEQQQQQLAQNQQAGYNNNYNNINDSQNNRQLQFIKQFFNFGSNVPGDTNDMFDGHHRIVPHHRHQNKPTFFNVGSGLQGKINNQSNNTMQLPGNTNCNTNLKQVQTFGSNLPETTLIYGENNGFTPHIRNNNWFTPYIPPKNENKIQNGKTDELYTQHNNEGKTIAIEVEKRSKLSLEKINEDVQENSKSNDNDVNYDKLEVINLDVDENKDEKNNNDINKNVDAEANNTGQKNENNNNIVNSNENNENNNDLNLEAFILNQDCENHNNIVNQDDNNRNENNNNNEQSINQNNPVQNKGQVIHQDNNVREENQQQQQIQAQQQVQQERKWYYYLNPFNWFKSCCGEPRVIENDQPRRTTNNATIINVGRERNN